MPAGEIGHEVDKGTDALLGHYLTYDWDLTSQNPVNPTPGPGSTRGSFTGAAARSRSSICGGSLPTGSGGVSGSRIE